MSSQSSTISSDRKIAFYSSILRPTHLAPRYWGTWVVVGILFLMAPLPLIITRAVGGVLGKVMFLVNRKRRRIVQVNLRLCFPDLSDNERARLMRRHFMVYGQSFTDIAHLAWSSRRRLQRMTRWRGLETYRQCLDQGRRVILLAPHFVGMNFSGALLAREHPTFCIMKPVRNAVIDWLLHRARTRFSARALQRNQRLLPAIRALQRGYTFFYLPDEDLGPQHSLLVPFFGVAAATLPTLGRIAALCNAVVIPCFVRLLPWGGGYEVILQPPLENFPTGHDADDAACMNRAIEGGVREIPEQYFWTFKMFKTRPAGEPARYR